MEPHFNFVLKNYFKNLCMNNITTHTQNDYTVNSFTLYFIDFDHIQ